MKKLITLILAICLVLTSIAGVSANSQGLFEGMNILTSLTERAETDYVRRDEFSAVAAAMMGLDSMGPADVPFSDVGKESEYGSAILTVKDGGVMNGVSSYEFAPESTITIRDAAVVFIRILGYQIWADSKGGYPNGYMQAATSLKLFNNITNPFDSMLTFGDLWTMADNVMETSVAEVSYGITDGTLSEEIYVNKNGLTLLEKNFGCTRYKAVVEETFGDTHSIRAEITEDDDRGNAKYKAGHTLTLKASSAVNIFAYDKTPVYIWITDNDELVYITPQENCEIIYGTVYSVERDTNADASYNTKEITELALWDRAKDIRISEDGASFYKNGNKVTGKLHLTNEYVRVVTKDGEITSVETWDFTEGGIVTDINFKSIVFNRGDVTEAISGIEDFSKAILILNGEIRDIKELKKDALIDFRISPDKEELIILASERKNTDILESISDDEVQIGTLILKTANTVYTYSNDRGCFVEGDLLNYTGSRVSAYVDSFGKVRYISTMGSVGSDSFIGYVMGTQSPKGLIKTKEILVANLDSADFTQKVYKVADSVNDSSYSLLTDSIDTKTAKSVFRFKVNAKGEITEFSGLKPYFGYAQTDGYVSIDFSGNIPGNGDPAYFEIDSKKLYFPRNEKITVIYENEGETAFGTTTYGDLEGKDTSGIYTFSFFGEDMSSEFDLILLMGDISNMAEHAGKFGIVSAVLSGKDADGEDIKIAEIDGKRYTVNKSDADILEENMLVYYKPTIGGFTSYAIDIIDTLKLNEKLHNNKGNTSDGGNISLKRGTIEKLDSKRIFIDDYDTGLDAYFFDRNGCRYIIYDETRKSFVDGNSYDFLQGKDVIYLLTSDQMVSVVFYLN